MTEETAARPGWSRLTLLCAPAGYGKTSTVALWFGDDDPDAGVHWIRCTRGSADAFWETLARVIAEILGEEAPAVAEGSLDSVRRLAAALPAPVTLIIDDYHHATSAANDLGLAELCEAAPMLSLVVIGRRLHVLDGPLVTGRIRVRSLGPRELALTDEAARGMAVRLGLAESEQLRSAIEQAEGWPLALRAAIDPMGLLSPEEPGTEASPSMPEEASAPHDPMENLARFALHHLEIVGEAPRRILLAAAQLDAICLDHAAEFFDLQIEEARAAVHELLELGLLVAVQGHKTTEFRCHGAVRPALARRARRSLSRERRGSLLRGRAARIADAAPFTAFTLYCQAEAYPEAESILAWHFSTITDEAEEAGRLLGSLPRRVLTAHPTFTAARLFLEMPDPAVPPSTLAHLTELRRQGLRGRMADSAETSSPMRFPLRAQAMVAARMLGDVETANRIAHELETRLAAAFPADALPSAEADAAAKLSPLTRAPGGLLVFYRELATTALLTGDFDRARRNWSRLRARAERLVAASRSGLPLDSARSVTDAESGHRWLLAALSGAAFTELLDGDMRRCAELLDEAEELASETGASAPGISWVGGEIVRAHLSYELRDESMLVRAMARLEPLVDRIEQWPLLLIAEAASTRYRRGADWALSHLRARLTGMDESRRPVGRWRDYLTGYRIMLHSVLGDLAAAERELSALPPGPRSRGSSAPGSHSSRAMRSRLCCSLSRSGTPRPPGDNDSIAA